MQTYKKKRLTWKYAYSYTHIFLVFVLPKIQKKTANVIKIKIYILAGEKILIHIILQIVHWENNTLNLFENQIK